MTIWLRARTYTTAAMSAENRSLATYFRWKTVPFWAVHVVALLGIVLSGWSWVGLGIAAASYFFRIFFVTAGYHRYFSHRSYKTSRAFQFILAFFAQTSVQKGVLWWAAHHRDHHKYADGTGDPHSPRLDGLWHAHMGWVLAADNDETKVRNVGDLAKYPELVWLDRWHLVPPILYAVTLFLVGGWFALLWGFFVSTVMTWHGTFTINSLTHVFGVPRFAVSDDSKNSWLLAIITLGEGWHNNHHYYQSATRQGFAWWEYDPTYYVLRGLALLGVVWDLREPSAKALAKRGMGLDATQTRRSALSTVAASL